MRRDDFDAIHMVKAVKGLPLHENAYSLVVIGRRKVRIREENKDRALEWFGCWAAEIVDQFGDQNKVIVPIPGSAVTREHDPCFRTALMAEATRAKCTTPVQVSTALRWKNAMPSTRQGGTRDSSRLLKNLSLLKDQLPDGDVVLMDDVLTTGGHIRAAAWKIESARQEILGAVCCGKSSPSQLDFPFNLEAEALDISR